MHQICSSRKCASALSQCCNLMMNEIRCLMSNKSVSYTHLDVYKRQDRYKTGSSKKGKSIWKLYPVESIMPVSYTHL